MQEIMIRYIKSLDSFNTKLKGGIAYYGFTKGDRDFTFTKNI
jgi:hypothetical protein